MKLLITLVTANVLAISTLIVIELGINPLELLKPEPYRVAVIDSGFTPLPYDHTASKLCSDGHYDFSEDTDDVGEDTLGHGSYVAKLINDNAETDNLCILTYKVFGGNADKSIRASESAVANAIIKAVDAGAKAINMSISFYIYGHELEKAAKYASANNVKLFVAAMNNGASLNGTCRQTPACFRGLGENLVVVGAIERNGEVAKYSNTGLQVAVYDFGDIGEMRGTSFAAPRALGNYIRSLNVDRR